MQLDKHLLAAKHGEWLGLEVREHEQVLKGLCYPEGVDQVVELRLKALELGLI